MRISSADDRVTVAGNRQMCDAADELRAMEIVGVRAEAQ